LRFALPKSGEASISCMSGENVLDPARLSRYGAVSERCRVGPRIPWYGRPHGADEASRASMRFAVRFRCARLRTTEKRLTRTWAVVVTVCGVDWRRAPQESDQGRRDRR